MKPGKNIEKIIRKFDIDINPEKDREIFNEIRQTQKKSKQSKSGLQPDIWRMIVHSKMTKFAAAAVIIIAAIIGINQFGGSVDMATVAWADVVEKFSSMPFYNAVLYLKKDTDSEPKQIELWVSSENKARARIGSQVLFIENGKIVAGFDYKRAIILPEEGYDEISEIVVELCRYQAISLDNIIRLVYKDKGQLVETTPKINPDARISQDLLVFDFDSTISTEWIRIWALRDSKLPIRLRTWDPLDGGHLDIVFTYEKQQPVDFFDYGKYKEFLMQFSYTTSLGQNRAYAYLKDPGGKDYVPQDIFGKAGYHVPIVERVGITEYGAVWIISSKAQNRGPDGRTFDGFSIVTDNLNRSYYGCVAGGYQSDDDISSQVFVPADYPFDKRVPDSIILTCEEDVFPPDAPKQTIGTVKIDQWEQKAPWPADRIRETETEIFLRTAYRFIDFIDRKDIYKSIDKTKDYDKADAIAKMIKASPDADKFAHKLNKLELRKLIRQKKFAEADNLAEQLWPIEFQNYMNPTKRSHTSANTFADYIIAISANGRVDRAAELWGRLRAAEPDLSGITNKRAQKHITKRIKEQFSSGSECWYIGELFSISKLNLEQVNKIIGFDVSQNEGTKDYVPQEYHWEEVRETIKWDKHLEELADHYKSKPLKPGEMEFRERPQVRSISKFSIPGFEGYNVMPVGGMLREYAKWYKYPDSSGRVKIKGDIANAVLQHEVIVNGKITAEEQIKFVLSQFGLEVIESEDICTVWIAQYNGQTLQDFNDIRSPVRRTHWSRGAPGTMAMGMGYGVGLGSLLVELSQHQGIVVENNTGIDNSTKMSLEIPNFKTEEGAKLAEEWYKKSFGITFRKEQRRMPIWIIQKKP